MAREQPRSQTREVALRGARCPAGTLLQVVHRLIRTRLPETTQTQALSFPRHGGCTIPVTLGRSPTPAPQHERVQWGAPVQ